jgi:hypothetical protein
MKHQHKMLAKPNTFRMETHRPGCFWGDLHGFALLLHWFLLLSASKPGNGIGPNGKTPQNQIPLYLGYILTFAH